MSNFNDDDDGEDYNGPEGTFREVEIREQDRYLPVANIARIMKKVLPTNAKIAKDAKESIQECVSEFISFITSEASDKCQQEKRKTINGDDILWAMTTLGFDKYVEPLKIYLSKYRESVKGDKPEKKIIPTKPKENIFAPTIPMKSTIPGMPSNLNTMSTLSTMSMIVGHSNLSSSSSSAPPDTLYTPSPLTSVPMSTNMYVPSPIISNSLLSTVPVNNSIHTSMNITTTTTTTTPVSSTINSIDTKLPSTLPPPYTMTSPLSTLLPPTSTHTMNTMNTMSTMSNLNTIHVSPHVPTTIPSTSIPTTASNTTIMTSTTPITMSSTTTATATAATTSTAATTTASIANNVSPSTANIYQGSYLMTGMINDAPLIPNTSSTHNNPSILFGNNIDEYKSTLVKSELTPSTIITNPSVTTTTTMNNNTTTTSTTTTTSSTATAGAAFTTSLSPSPPTPYSFNTNTNTNTNNAS